jgi:hypothetical protein
MWRANHSPIQATPMIQGVAATYVHACSKMFNMCKSHPDRDVSLQGFRSAPPDSEGSLRKPS